MFTLPKDEATDDGMPVTVVYRRWLTHSGSIIALFPFIPASVTNAEDDCTAYEHVGQHGAANYLHCIEGTRAVDERDAEETAKLYMELRERGYELSPMTHEEVCYEAGFKAGQKEGSPRQEAAEKLIAKMAKALKSSFPHLYRPLIADAENFLGC
jgi:hypothetical protein